MPLFIWEVCLFLFLHFLFVEKVGRAKFYPVLYQCFITLQHLYPEVNIQKQHGYKKPDNNGDKKYKHALNLPKDSAYLSIFSASATLLMIWWIIFVTIHTF